MLPNVKGNVSGAFFVLRSGLQATAAAGCDSRLQSKPGAPAYRGLLGLHPIFFAPSLQEDGGAGSRLRSGGSGLIFIEVLAA